MKEFIYNHIKNSDIYISTQTANLIIEELKAELLKNKQSFLQLQEIDSKYSDQIINISTMLNILEAYKNKQVKEGSKKEIVLTSYYGNPYITINLIAQSLYCKKAIILAIEDEMIGINKLLVSIFNDVLKKYKISKIVKLCNIVSVEEIFNNKASIKKVICVGNYETYKKLKNKEIDNLRYMPFKNMVIFSENDKYLDLQYKLYQYAIANGIEIEVYDDIEISEFVKCIQIDNSLESVVVFTDNDKTINNLRENLKSVKLFINENPFKNEKFVLDLMGNN